MKNEETQVEESSLDDLNFANLGEDFEVMEEINESGGGEEPSKATEENSDLIEIPDAEDDSTTEQQSDDNDNKDENFEVPDEDDEDQEELENLEEIEDKNTPSSQDNKDSSPSSSLYKAFTEALAEEGVIPEYNEEEFETALKEGKEPQEILMDNIRNTIRAEVDNYKNSLSDEDRALYEAKEKGIPLDALGQVRAVKKQYESINEDSLSEDESLQEKLVKEDLKSRGFSDDEIDDTIESFKDTNKLEARSKSSLERLKTAADEKEKDLIKQNEQALEDQKKQKEEDLKQIKNFLNDKKEIVPGLKINEKSVEAVIDSMTKPVAKDDKGNLYNKLMVNQARNPQAFNAMLHYYNTLGLFNIDENGNASPDFSKITKKAISKATNKLASALETNSGSFKSGKRTTQRRSSDSDDEFSLGSL